jgi:hypothetical protein
MKDMPEKSSDAVSLIPGGELPTTACEIQTTTMCETDSVCETDSDCVGQIISESKGKPSRRTFLRKKPSEKWLKKRRSENAARQTVRLVTKVGLKRVRFKYSANFWTNHIVGIIK